MLNLIQILQSLEKVANRYQHTVAALSSLGTLAAVVVSLATAYAAQRASQPRLKAYISIYVVRTRIERNPATLIT